MECFKTFRKAPPSQLIMTLLVKNEESMLEENLLFHKAMGVDSFIITDNNSTDSTPEIIRKYKQKGWIKEVIEEKATVLLFGCFVYLNFCGLCDGTGC